VLSDHGSCACGQDMTAVELFCFCPHCGARQVADSSLCSKCGKPQAFKLCPNCGDIQPEDAGACGNCGFSLAAMARLCLFCGTENPEDALRCRDCGMSVADARPVASGDVLYLWRSGDNACCELLGPGPVVVGRGVGSVCSDYLCAHNYSGVSNSHLSLNVPGDGGSVTATDVSRNGSWLNDGKMTRGAPVLIVDRDEISLNGPSDDGRAACFSLVRVKGLGEPV